ncbi:hypothetical protein [Streptomyces sp. MP131-18]|uniref:hypothetical protein n=1 Tax=Streptomyces sp. MP131-18 TaxID=1857892 RepID=UPI00097C000D|nr:hypothetical protein [Streptomyces sp. MP131-18]ONK11993.1 hypothetical protein STBA_27290 [Streptomyces sp. MP131-18]
MSGNGRIWRHRFEPARLVLGVALIGVACVYLVDAAGRGDVPLPVLFALLPAALLCTAGVAVAAMAARRARGRPRDEPRDEPRGQPDVSRTGAGSAGPDAR